MTEQPVAMFFELPERPSFSSERFESHIVTVVCPSVHDGKKRTFEPIRHFRVEHVQKLVGGTSPVDALVTVDASQISLLVDAYRQ